MTEMPFGLRLKVRFPISIAFIVALVVESGGVIVLLPAYYNAVYVSLIGLKLVNVSSPVRNRLPKTAFELLLLMVLVAFAMFGAPCLPPTTLKVAPVVALVD